VFADFIDDSRTSHLSPGEQYELIREQLTWIGVMAAEIRSKLRIVIEISETALALMDIAGRQTSGN
jgi:hypothetical protein